MQVLLTSIDSKYIHQNLAIRILYALNQHHTGLSVKEFTLKNSPDEVAQYCNSFNVVAFSCYIWNIEPTLKAAQKIKALNPFCKILLGGPEVSFEWDDIMALPYVDYIILDEGEIPFTAFLNQYPNVETVPGLVWKNQGRVVNNGPSPLPDVTQWLSINPYLSIPDDEILHKISYIEASRGCPNCCEFCLAGLQNKVRYLPLSAIQQNLLYLMERGRVIKFLDRTFNTHPAFAVDLFKFIMQHHRPGNVFQFEIKADVLQPDLVDYIRKEVPKGLFRFEIGIQTLNSKSNREVRRHQNFENIKTFVELVSPNIELHLDLIVGLPHDYLDDIKYSFDEVFKLFAPELQLGFLKFLKGTPLRQNALEHGYKFDARPPYQIVESNYLSASELAEITLVEHVLDVYWNRKRAINTLRYVAQTYSAYDFFNDLGRCWQQLNNLQNNGLNAIYTLLFEFSAQQYPHDAFIRELIALDYYLHHKIRPANRFLPEIDKKEQHSLIKRLNLNHHKYRYVIHRVGFSVPALIGQHALKAQPDWLIIEYTGTTNPRIVPLNEPCLG